MLLLQSQTCCTGAVRLIDDGKGFFCLFNHCFSVPRQLKSRTLHPIRSTSSPGENMTSALGFQTCRQLSLQHFLISVRFINYEITCLLMGNWQLCKGTTFIITKENMLRVTHSLVSRTFKNMQTRSDYRYNSQKFNNIIIKLTIQPFLLPVPNYGTTPHYTSDKPLHDDDDDDDCVKKC